MTDSEILQRYVDEVQPVTGWPEWTGRGIGIEERRLRLFLPLGGHCTTWHIQWRGLATDNWYHSSWVGDHEALCLWQNHTIAWFHKRFTYVSIEWDGDSKQWMVMVGFYVPKGEDTGNLQLKADSHDKNIHLALIAAAKEN